MDIENAPIKSMNNFAAVQNANVCGCYFCRSVFSYKTIKEWTDGGDTALCPRCGADTVLPGVRDTGILSLARKRWFVG